MVRFWQIGLDILWEKNSENGLESTYICNTFKAQRKIACHRNVVLSTFLIKKGENGTNDKRVFFLFQVSVGESIG